MRGFRARSVFFLCVAATVGACSGDSGGWAAEHGFDPDEVHEIRIGAYGFPFVPVAIDGDTVELMFDTGNMVGVSLTGEKLEELDLPRIGEWTRLAGDGSVVGRYGVHRAESVSVFGVELPPRVYQWAHPRLPGLVGPRFLRGKRFTLDYDAGVLGVSEEPTDPASRPAGGVPLVRSERHPDLLLVHGQVEGRRVLMELDTGKSRTVVDPELAEALGLAEVERGVEIGDLRLGSHRFEVPSARLSDLGGIDPDLEEPIEVGIGSDLLSRVVLAVDGERETAWFLER